MRWFSLFLLLDHVSGADIILTGTASLYVIRIRASMRPVIPVVLALGNGREKAVF